MKQSFFVTATNTDVGKSYACEVFLKKFAQQGYKVGYFKPIETGVENLPQDGSKLLKIVQELNPDFTFTIDDIVPYQFSLPAAPFVAKEDSNININSIINQAKKLHKMCDILIIEGAGGLMVPIEKDFFIIDLIKFFQTKLQTNTLLISPSNLGSINDTLLSIHALNSYKIKHQWYINLYKDKHTFESITLPFYKTYFDQINYL
jgi:dethiobiotin synthetase